MQFPQLCRYFFLSWFVCFSQIIVAQTTSSPTKVVNPNWPDLRFKQELFIYQPDGSPIKRGYQNVTGSPYLLPAMKKVKVFLTDIKQYVEVVGNLDLYSHELLFLDEKRTPLIVSEDRISEFNYADTVGNSITLHKLVNGFTPTAFVGKYDYFEVLADGKISLLQLRKVSLVESKNDLTGERNSYFDPYKELYISKDGNLIRLGKKQKETIVGAMDDKKSPISTYLQDKKLSLKSEGEILQLIQYYNSL